MLTGVMEGEVETVFPDELAMEETEETASLEEAVMAAMGGTTNMVPVATAETVEMGLLEVEKGDLVALDLKGMGKTEMTEKQINRN